VRKPIPSRCSPRCGLVRRKKRPGKRPIKMRSLQVEPLEKREMLSIAPLADERLVNSYTAGTQRLYDCTEALAADPAGNYLLTWSSASQDGNGMGVYAPRRQPTRHLRAAVRRQRRETRR